MNNTYEKIASGELSIKQAAGHLGLHPNTVSRHLKKLGIKRPTPLRTKAKLKRIAKEDKQAAVKRMVPAQMSIEQASKVLDVSVRTLYRWLDTP